MKNKKGGLEGMILFIIFMLIFTLLLIVIEEYTSEYKGTNQVECYDENNNEINELTCTEEIYCGIVREFFGVCEK